MAEVTVKTRKPRGAKLIGGQLLSAKEFAARYRTLAIALPVVKPADGEWSEFRAALDKSLELVRIIGNRTVSALLGAEPEREDQAKLAAMPQTPTLYRSLSGRYPQIATGSISAVMRDAQLRYKAARFGVFKTGRETPPTFRQGRAPLPIRAQDYEFRFGPDGEPLVTFRLGSREDEDGRRWTVQLKRGRDWERQLRTLRQVSSGDGRFGAMSLRLKTVANGNRDCTLLHYRDRFGRRVPHLLLATIVCQIPRTDRPGLEGTLCVRLLADSMLGVSAAWEAEPYWRLHGDDLKALVVRHKVLLQRLGDDKKCEERHRRNRIDRRVVELCDKHERRMTTSIQRAARMLCNLAARKRVARLEYDESGGAFMPTFPWFAFWNRVKTVCEGEMGISVARRERGEKEDNG